MSRLKKSSAQMETEIRKAMADLHGERHTREGPLTEYPGGTSGTSAEDTVFQGSTLLAWLIETANERGLRLREMAEAIGVSYEEVHDIRTGLKPISGLSEKVLDSCAQFLDVPRLAVMIAADREIPAVMIEADKEMSAAIMAIMTAAGSRSGE